MYPLEAAYRKFGWEEAEAVQRARRLLVQDADAQIEPSDLSAFIEVANFHPNEVGWYQRYLAREPHRAIPRRQQLLRVIEVAKTGHLVARQLLGWTV